MILIIKKGTQIFIEEEIPKPKHLSWLEHLEHGIKLAKKNKKSAGMLFEIEDLEELREFIKEFEK